MLIFIAGLMVGGMVGVFTMCLMFAAKEADRHIEDYEYEAAQRESAASSPKEDADEKNGD